MSRATSLFLTVALLLTLVPTFVLVSPEPALATEYISNGGFGSWTDWTQYGANEGGNGDTDITGGEMRHFTLDDQDDAADLYYGETTQTIGTTINSGDTVLLSLDWWKENVEDAATKWDIWVEIRKPSGSVVTIWSDSTIPGDQGTGSGSVTSSDLSANFDENGTYEIRLVTDVATANTGDPDNRSIGRWDNVSLDVTVNANTTTIGNGSDPANATVARSDTSQTVDAFSIQNDAGNDTITTVSILGSADTTSGSVSLAKLYADTNDDGLLDAGDTLLGTGTFSGTTAAISSLSIEASATLENYVVAYDITAGAPDGATLTGRVTAVTAPSIIIYNDSGSATLTVDAAAPGTVTQFLATSGKDARVPISWQNPSDSDFNRVRVLRRTDQYPTSASDGSATNIYEQPATSNSTENIIDTERTNNQTYYYAAFTRDAVGNWNNTVTASVTADTATPNAMLVGDSASSVADATVMGDDANQAVGVFNLWTTGGSDTVTTMTVTGSVDTTQGSVATARIFSDAGTLGVLDGGDTTVASVAFSGSSATFTGLSLNVNTTPDNYLITYDIAAGPTDGAELTGYVSSATASTYEVLASTDTIDATLTVDSQAPGTVSNFSAGDDEDQQSTLEWKNPSEPPDFDRVRVLRRTDQYPTSATDTIAGSVYDAAETAGATVTIVDPSLTNDQTYWYAAFTQDAVGNWNNTVTAATTADTGTPSLPPIPTLVVNDGSPGFSDTTVGPSYVNQAVDAFTLRMSQATDTVTAITVTGSGDTDGSNVSAARLFSDAGTIGVLDAGDTTITADNFIGNTVSFTGLNIDVDTTTANYLVAYSISAGASHNAKLDGYVSSVTSTTAQALSYQDTIDATLTVDAQAPGTITFFDAAEFGDTASNLSWTNPGDPDLAEVKVVRKEGSYPSDHTDGTAVLDDTVAPFATSFPDTDLTNGVTYFYAAFAQDSYGNWNSSVVEGTNADTATPQALTVAFSNNTQDASGDTFYHGQTGQLMQSFQLLTNGGNGSWTQIGLQEYGGGTATNNVAAVRLFRDDGNSTFDGGDTELTLSPTTFSAEDTTFTITGGETLTSATQEYFVVYDFTDDTSSEATVTVASRLTADESIVVTSGTVSGIDPAKSSGTGTLYPNTVTPVGGTDTAPSPTILQEVTDDFLRWQLTTNFGTAVWTGVTVDRTGTAADTDVGAVKIYKSSDASWGGGDTLIGQGSFSSGKATISFSAPNYQTITTAATSYYFVTLTITENADVAKTIGAQIDSSGTITLAPPDGIGSFSFSSGAPEIEESINDTSAPNPPTNLTATSTVSSQVLLNWTAATDPETSITAYNIYRSYESFDASSYETDALLIDTIAPATSYTDTTATGLITGEDYWYAVSAINEASLKSAISNVATITVSGKNVPHYTFDTTTGKCRICHKLHNSPARAKVFRKFPEIQICFTCHDGTGSDYNIQQVWADSAHDGTETALYTADTFIQCVKCHNPHGADPDYGTPFFLTRRVEENLCFRCHSTTGETPVASANGWYIEDQMTSSVTVSRHAVVSTTTKNGQGYYPEGTATTADGLTGARIECTNCHNPMVIQRGTLGSNFLARLTDPFNTWNLTQDSSQSDETDFVNFCLNCHNSTGQPIATASATTIVPYTIAFPSMSTTDYPFFFGWDKTDFRDSSPTSAHFDNSVICRNCHNPHGSRNQRLMAFGYDADTSTATWDYYYDDSANVSNEQNLCYACHGTTTRAPYGNAPDIQSEFAKAGSGGSAMPIGNSNRHADTEQQSDFDDGNRHSECYDCHDPHKAQAGNRGTNNLAGPPLTGAIGVSVTNGAAGTVPTYTVTRDITYEYELCFKCHSSYADLPTGYSDKGLQFNPNNSSFHPVETTGHNDSTNLDNQLENGLSTDAIISCTDCHNNNATVGTLGWVANYSGSAVIGPHGSTEIRLLRDNFETDPSGYPWDGTQGELCFVCHQQSDLRGTNSNYHDRGGYRGRDNLHAMHMGGRTEDAICVNCHYNIHSNQEANNTVYRIRDVDDVETDYTNGPPPTSVLRTTRLINFSPEVNANGGGTPIWRYDLDTNIRDCSISCHGGGMDLGSERYGPSSGDPTQ